MNKKILVVDDEPKNLKLLKDFLEVSGYSVLLAGNGREAIDIALVHGPGLILMDLHLPVMDGLSATKILKSSPQTCQIPVLFLSGLGVPEGGMGQCNAGCDDYISKPFKLGELRDKIKKYLGK